MSPLKKICQEIRLRRSADLSARIMHMVDTATGAYKRRLSQNEPTSAEFLKTLKYGSAETVEEFIEEHYALPLAWKNIPKSAIPDELV